jgi:site-specific DNA-methyltransferase (adenine-specific)
LSEEYAKAGTMRLNETSVGQQLTGAPEPKMSAPKTWQGKANKKTRQQQATLTDESAKELPVDQRIAGAINDGILTAWQSLGATGAVKDVLADEAVAERFYSKCDQLGIPGSRSFLSDRLFEVVSKLPPTQATLCFSDE